MPTAVDASQNATLSPVREHFRGFLDAIDAVQVDLDADGLDEMVVHYETFSGTGIAVFGETGGTFGLRHKSGLGCCVRGGIHPVFSADGAVTAIALRDADTIQLLAGPTLEPLAGPRPFQGSVGAIGDVDGDGDPDVVSKFGVSATDLGSGGQLWQTTLSGDIELAQLDADPALEVILFGEGTGYVLDGATGMVEITHAGGFGEQVLVGNFDSDAAAELLGVDGLRLTAYDLAPFQPVWEATRQTGGTVAVAEQVGADAIWTPTIDGRVEVRLAPAYGVHTSFSSGSPRLAQIFASVFDTEGEVSLFWLSGASIDQREYVLGNTRWNGEQRFRLPMYEGIVRSMAVGDLDGSGQGQIVLIAGDPSHFHHVDPRIEVMDRVSGELLHSYDGRVLFADTNPYLLDMALAQCDQDAALELVVTGARGDSGHVRMFDGTGFGLQWEHTADAGYVRIETAVPIRTLGEEPAVAVTLRNSSARILRALDCNGATLWTSASHDDEVFFHSASLITGDLDGDSADEVLMGSVEGVRVYGVDGNFEWSSATPALGLALDTERAEIVTASRMDLGILDLILREQVRQFEILNNGGVAHVAEGVVATTTQEGGLAIVNTIDGELLASAPGVDAYDVTRHGIQVLPGTDPFRKAIVVVTETGVAEYELLLDESHIFGGQGGGFESP